MSLSASSFLVGGGTSSKNRKRIEVFRSLKYFLTLAFKFDSLGRSGSDNDVGHVELLGRVRRRWGRRGFVWSNISPLAWLFLRRDLASFGLLGFTQESTELISLVLLGELL